MDQTPSLEGNTYNDRYRPTAGRLLAVLNVAVQPVISDIRFTLEIDA